MRRPKSYVPVIACWVLLGGAGAAAAADDEVSLPGEVLEPLEVHVFTPPKEQLKGPDIVVDTWPDRDPTSQIIDHVWKPGRPSGIRVIDAQNNDPSRIRVIRWPGDPHDSDIVVHRWEPGRPSLIRVHGPY